jgi:hypothetical protein
MIYYKEECEKLVSCRATILVHDTYTENSTPILAVRTVSGMAGLKSGRDSKWYVVFDTPVSNGCDGTSPNYILGVNTGDSLDISPLVDFIHKRHAYPSMQERIMLISDARVRLKEARI